MPYKLSVEAALNLKDILKYGQLNFGERQALKYQNSLKRVFELLADMPSLGRKSERGAKNEHRFIHGKHVIYYSVASDRILIENIIFGPIITDIWGEDL
ncbi:MAG: type II toxin-antitoxin system RelE/ParE family toxin [Pseudomonadota bacterium]